MFFAIREPVFAATLLRRAIAVAPDVPLYAERLGTVYAYAFFPEPQLRGFHVDYTPERETFRQEAQVALLSSNDWVLVAGAFGDAYEKWSWIPRELSSLLQLRLEVLTGERDTWSRIRKLPSQSARYRGSECDALFSKQK